MFWLWLSELVILVARKTAYPSTNWNLTGWENFFDENLYGPSRFIQQRFIHKVHPATEDDFSNLKDDAGAMFAISGLRLDLPSGENDLLTFISAKYPDPSTTPAILELGSYYYNKNGLKIGGNLYNGRSE